MNILSTSGRPAKRARLLDDDESASESEGSTENEAFSINKEYAARHEHNKKREERQRLEEKYANDQDISEDSDSEEEDDEGELATKDLDNEIATVLNAIRSKDPRVYDKDNQFYRDPEGAAADIAATEAVQKDKPVYLADYHRRNLLADVNGAHSDDEQLVPTYDQEQHNLKQDLIAQMHSTIAEHNSEGEDDLLTKKKSQPKQRRASRPVLPDPKAADRDPEAFLSDFMASRAWVPHQAVPLQPFESDDDSDDARADEWEAAYNLRFEDPAHANEKLISHSREAAAKYSVRRDDAHGRRRAREIEKERKDAAKAIRTSEKQRLRNLKIEEAHEKLQKFKEAAGGNANISPEDWASFLEAGWDSNDWDREMAKRFGDDYYTQPDAEPSDAEEDGQSRNGKKNKSKKPKWNDDIDIADIIPSFVEEEERIAKPTFTLSSDEEDDQGKDDIVEGSAETSKTKATTKKDARRTARLERRAIESLVDANLPILTQSQSTPSNAQPTQFRYRATSPISLGLSSTDILFASDAALNQFAGLKKLAAFRDEDRKVKDRRKLGKKSRLRMWRRETFGDEDGPKVMELVGAVDENGDEAEVPAEKKKKKRSRKRKAQDEGVSRC